MNPTFFLWGFFYLMGVRFKKIFSSSNVHMAPVAGSIINIPIKPPKIILPKYYRMAGVKCVKPWEKTTTTCKELGMVGECEECNNLGWQSTPIPLHGVECNDGNGICSNGICVPKE